MGCVSSKQTVAVTPAADYSSGALRDTGEVNAASYSLQRRVDSEKSSSAKVFVSIGGGIADSAEMCAGSRRRGSSMTMCESGSVSFRLGNLHKYVEGEQVAAGWPAWLSAVAGEAIQGWVPLRAESFEKLEKIGQGTYSSVFRARELSTGKIVASKKVRFDNFEPESVRFMAREILILRRLDHPNVMKLEGIITSRLSCSIYLVFEYMEHDLSGLISCPDIKFSESQVKCYMKQLLSGLEHCHARGVMHRDIKGSNLLLNNEGILKVADFGLANFYNLGNKHPLTSRVVTLWYRPPELLLGANDYGPSVDLWSVGCVFAEALLGKPLLQGRTEVEQLHKIFKLCGSPPDEYWNKSRLPHSTIFKPHQHYESSLHRTCKDLPRPALDLIETLLSVEPYKRGDASSALDSEYFATKPYACDPLSLPKYPPNKEIDVKFREEARRKKLNGRPRVPERSRKAPRKPNGSCKLPPSEVTNLDSLPNSSHPTQALPSGPIQTQNVNRVKINGSIALFPSEENNIVARGSRKLSVDQTKEASHIKNASQGDIPFSGPLPVPSSSGFAWVKNRRDSGSGKSHSRSSSKASLNGFERQPSSTSHDRSNSEMSKENRNILSGPRAHSRGHDYFEAVNPMVHRQRTQFDRLDSFDGFEGYHSQDLSMAHYQKEIDARRNNMDNEDRVEFSGPLLSQTNRIDELLEKHERHVRQAVRRSWFQKGTQAQETSENHLARSKNHGRKIRTMASGQMSPT